jgi:hypothetical protein
MPEVQVACGRRSNTPSVGGFHVYSIESGVLPTSLAFEESKKKAALAVPPLRIISLLN